MRFLARRIAIMPLLLVVSYRDALGSGHPLRPVLGDLVAVPDGRRLQLTPLSRSAVATLLHGHGLDPVDVQRLGVTLLPVERHAAGGGVGPPGGKKLRGPVEGDDAGAAAFPLPAPTSSTRSPAATPVAATRTGPSSGITSVATAG